MERLIAWGPRVRKLAQTRNPELHELADLLARRAPRTETYPHDCGCETCGDHTPPRAPRVEAVTDAMVEAGVEAWLAKINEAMRIEHEMARDEIVRAILTAALRTAR